MECVALGSVASVKSGFAFKSKDWKDDGVPVIKIANVKDGFVTLDGCSFVDEAVAKSAAAFELRPGDILISMTGYIGEIARVRNEGRMLLNQRVGKFNIKRGAPLDSDFLFHCLRDPELKAKFVAHAYGAAQPNISPTLIEQQEIPFPLLPIQRRIAGILSAYDELIENSQRRIKILESMARALYREWFVHFRFPGHESVPLVASPLGEIPQGWEVGRLDDLLVLQRGFDLPKANRVEGEVPIYAATGVTGFHNKAIVKGPGVVTGRSGTIGSVIYVHEDFWPLNTALWVKEFPKAKPLYAYYVLLSLDLKQFNSGAAVPTLNRNDIHGLDALIPPRQLQQKFQDIASSMLNQARTLELQIQNLRCTRDLLLPRLLSGQIDVDALARISAGGQDNCLN
jgi:type I restriction enzyme S subunit